MKVGDRLPEVKIPCVSAEKMRTMTALMRDPNPIHYDPEAVRRLGLGDRVVNQGPLNQAYIVTALARWAGGTDRVRRLRVRHEGTAFAGDRLRACGEVTGIDAGTAECAVRLEALGQQPRTVLSGTATVRYGAA